MSPDTSALLISARDHYRQNRLVEAQAQVRIVLQDDPANLPALLLMAGIDFRRGSYTESIQCLDAVLGIDPDQAEAVGLLALIYKARGDYVSAANQFDRLTKLGQANAETYTELGSCWLSAGDAKLAGAAFMRAIELDRNTAKHYYNLGLALNMAGKSFETYATFKRAIQLDPDYHDSYVQLWEQMRQLVFWTEGLPLLEQGLSRHPQSTQLQVMLAVAYGSVGARDKAEELFKSAIALDPKAGPSYAHWLQENGRFEESVPLLKAAIRRNHKQGQAYYNLATANCFDMDGSQLVDLIHPLLTDASVEQEDRMFLYYALAKSYDRVKDYEQAMANYDLANETAFEVFGCKVTNETSADPSGRETLSKIYSRRSLETLEPFGSKETLPTFIVGMIRTGTTLLDQLLSSHPDVRSVGEQPFWQICAGRLNRRWLQSGAQAADLKELEAGYLQVLKGASQGALRVVDKMPTNFLHIGLMSIVFPKAKFIHIRRSPVDTAVSIYTTFLGRGTQFAYNKRNIVEYYREYLDLMDLWRSILPAGRMIEIDYEELVTNKEAVLRRLLAFCGLAWDESVLSHEEHRSQVSTPSLWTVRQPVNNASVERWRRYEPWLGELLELKDVSHPPATSYSR
jgi:tetratricopeptide (TPR) repeat protein